MAAFLRQATDPLPTTEIFGPVVSNPDIPQANISYGLPFEQALVKHLDAMPNVSKVFFIASKSLVANTDVLPRLQATLGAKLVGRRIGMKAHTMWDECLEVAEEVRRVGGQCLLALGGSSIGDAAKFIAMAALEPLETFEQIEPLLMATAPTLQTGLKPLKYRALPIISVPTTLSAGEHTPGIGFTDSSTGLKYQIAGPRPQLIIYDPHLSLATPAHLWLSTGIRGLDHAVESLCAVETLPALDEIAAQALRLLVPGLLRCHADPSDVQARLNCQLGVSLSIMPLCRGLPLGASHAIGHMLGPMGVGHGETSCILLPAVCRYNMPVNAGKQHEAVKALKGIPEVEALARERGFGPEAELEDYLDAVIRALGMPRSLSAVGVMGDDRLQQLAERSMKDVWTHTNPRKIKNSGDVLQILEIVRG